MKAISILLALILAAASSAFIIPLRPPSPIPLRSSSPPDNDPFASQRSLLQQITSSQTSKADAAFKKRSSGLITDTVFYSTIIFSLLWFFTTNPLVPLSYLLGATSGTFYTYALGKQVSTVGKSEFNVETVSDGATGQARFAFLLILFILISRFNNVILPVPAIGGFFTYFVAALSQSFVIYDD